MSEQVLIVHSSLKQILYNRLNSNADKKTWWHWYFHDAHGNSKSLSSSPFFQRPFCEQKLNSVVGAEQHEKNQPHQAKSILPS